MTTDPEQTTTTTPGDTTPTTDELKDKTPKVELIPKSTQTGRTWNDTTWYTGVLIARREANSMTLNSVGPLWIIEVIDEDPALNGRIVRTFENPGDDIVPGNPNDDTPRLQFQVKKMLRPDMVRIEVATGVKRG